LSHQDIELAQSRIPFFFAIAEMISISPTEKTRRESEWLKTEKTRRESEWLKTEKSEWVNLNFEL
jgi:hypothetical protein